MLKKKGKKNIGMMGLYSCCMSNCGWIHFVLGAGAALLVVEYLGLTDLLVWGWILVVVGVLGHLTGKAKH